MKRLVFRYLKMILVHTDMRATGVSVPQTRLDASWDSLQADETQSR